ncbi:MAG: hypothetical protein QW350_00730 [Candidatus Aenigmatarchaeota archaeon]
MNKYNERGYNERDISTIVRAFMHYTENKNVAREIAGFLLIMYYLVENVLTGRIDKTVITKLEYVGSVLSSEQGKKIGESINKLVEAYNQRGPHLEY